MEVDKSTQGTLEDQMFYFIIGELYRKLPK